MRLYSAKEKSSFNEILSQPPTPCLLHIGIFTTYWHIYYILAALLRTGHVHVLHLYGSPFMYARLFSDMQFAFHLHRSLLTYT